MILKLKNDSASGGIAIGRLFCFAALAGLIACVTSVRVRAYDIADFPFDHAYGGAPTSIVDQAHAQPVTLTVQGSSSLEYASPSPGGGTDSMYFNNIGTGNDNGSHLVIPDNDVLTQGTSGGFQSLSISVWIKPDEYRLGQIVRKTALNLNEGYQLFLHTSGLIYFRVEQAGSQFGQIASSQPVPLDGQWHHVVALWNGNTANPELSLSIDGVTATSNSSNVVALTNTSTPLTVGSFYRSASSTGQYFSGGIDNLVLGEIGATTPALSIDFDNPNYGQSPITAQDQANGLLAHATVQGSSSVGFSTLDPQAGAQSLLFSNGGTSNLDGSLLTVDDDPLLTGSSWGGGLTSLLIDAWIKPTEYRQAQIVRKTEAATNEGYQLFLHSSGLVYFRVQQANGQYAQIATSSTVPLDADWHHLVARWDGLATSPTVSLALDGALTSVDSSNVSQLSDTSSPLTIGGLWRGVADNGQFFNGEIDQLRIGTASEHFVNAIGMQFEQIPAGTFQMGQTGFNFDEEPVHTVTIDQPFYLGTTEVTNAQFEQFQPSHARGELAQSDHPVTYVSYQDAVDFCAWLTSEDDQGRIYRLPTEAEWEYAARAETTGAYPSGAALPAGYDLGAVTVRTNPPNPWGLYEMFGNVEEWCHDWYGAYTASAQTDPVGRSAGDTRVTRGGSYYFGISAVDPLYMRSANRGSTMPVDKDRVLGFRVAVGPLPSTSPVSPDVPAVMQSVSQTTASYTPIQGPYFKGPLNYVKVGDDLHGPQYSQHNHDPGVTHLPNGDLLAIWFSTEDDGPVLTEQGRRISILGSRLRYGQSEWDDPSVFFDAADRNEGGPALWLDEPTGTVYYFNGLGSVNWSAMAMIARKSTDNGATWSDVQLAQPHGGQAGAIDSVIRTTDGKILVPLDNSGTALARSIDNGASWFNPFRGVNNTPVDGGTGVNIWGIHAGIVELLDGRLMALGRSNTTIGLPMSIADDSDALEWSYSRTDLPEIAAGQRLVLKRLREGPLLLVSFTDRYPEGAPDLLLSLRDADGNLIDGYGMYAAVSYDEGLTWPVRKLVTAIRAGEPSQDLEGRGWTHEFTMTAARAEDKGYLTAIQTPDNVIHLFSSGLHYQFDLQWLELGAYHPIAHWNLDRPDALTDFGDSVSTAVLEPFHALTATTVIQSTSTLRYTSGSALLWDSTSALAGAVDFLNAGTGNDNGSYFLVDDSDELSGHANSGAGHESLEISLWIKPSEWRQSQLLRHTAADDDVGIQLYMSVEGKIGFRIEQSTGEVAHLQSSKAVPLDGAWHHVVATWRGADYPVNFAIDIDAGWSVSTLVNSSITALSNPAAPLSIGALWRHSGSSGQFFNGQIDQVALRTFAPPAPGAPDNWPPSQKPSSTSSQVSNWLQYQ